jgi:hypothetical protein
MKQQWQKRWERMKITSGTLSEEATRAAIARLRKIVGKHP